MDKIRLFEMFAGYGGASFALSKAGVDFECVGYSEIDKFAIACYSKNHPGVQNFGSCKDIVAENLPDFDLLTAGFPCQDVSIAGERDLTKGRTLLIHDVFRILDVKKPKYVILENVKGLLSMDNLWDSIRWTLKNLGYGVLFKVLNSKEYGIPQNRERIWIVCKFGGWDFMEFQFPEKEKLSFFVHDILDDVVDNKFYLNETQIKRLSERSNDCSDGISGSLTASMFKQNWNTPIVADFRYDDGLRVREDGCSPCLSTCMKDNLSLSGSVIVHNIQQRSSDRPSVKRALELGLSVPGGSGHLSKSDGTIYCLDTNNSMALEFSSGFWRRLTPRECFRLMGFLDDEIDISDLSDTQAYKLAGNGWDINLASKIFKRLFK